MTSLRKMPSMYSLIDGHILARCPLPFITQRALGDRRFSPAMASARNLCLLNGAASPSKSRPFLFPNSIFIQSSIGDASASRHVN